MSMNRPGSAPVNPLRLEFPQSLAVYDDYAAAQRSVDHLSDQKFPVEQLMIVGTDLKRIERITGRLTTSRVALGGVLSGVWLGLFVGLLLSLLATGARARSRSSCPRSCSVRCSGWCSRSWATP